MIDYEVIEAIGKEKNEIIEEIPFVESTNAKYVSTRHTRLPEIKWRKLNEEVPYAMVDR